jgi:murein DD-endopeptidase MepM/ murein hydrolase activator NlpD
LIDKILSIEAQVAERTTRLLRTYPKQITVAVTALLLFTGGGAFAVASLGPDAADLSVTQVFETVTPLSFAEQVEALNEHSLTLFRTETTRSSDTADALLRRLGINDPAAAAFVRRNAEARTALLGRAGRTVSAEATQENTLSKLSARWIPDGEGRFKRVVIEKTPVGFRVRSETDALTPGTRLASGAIATSLFAATDASGIPDAIASQLADIFSGDLNLRALRKGDRFAIVYETFEGDGQILRSGRILSAEFENRGKIHQALWFEDGGKGSYYRPNGDSLRRAYLSSPVAFSRVTSGFAMRMHPIQHQWRKHNGIDFAAPTGTPVRAVGDGAVAFAGTQNGYGNIVILKHRNNQETAYAHLSRIDVKVGQSIGQGDILGAVGATGWATGPHLHFEFRVAGQYQDPSTIAEQEGGMPISAASRPAFDRLAMATRAELLAAFSMVRANAD